MGLGTFGGSIGAARCAAENGAMVTVTDLKSSEELADSVAKLDGLGITFVFGKHDTADFTGADIVIASPAVPVDSPYLAAAADAGAELTTEIGLFAEVCPSAICGITGSNGKTTTVSMLRSILERSGRSFYSGGNIGGSLLADLHAMTQEDIVVLELSSFQLEWLGRMKWSPNIAAVLNLTPNHIDRHGTFVSYTKAKRAILANQNVGDTAVLVADDQGSRAMAPSVRGKCLWVGSELDGDGITIENGWITVRKGEVTERMFDTWNLRIPGRHNIINAMTAAACAYVMEIDPAAVSDGLAAFSGIPHRLEFICERDGVKYFNDSKATTPEAAAAAVNAFDGTVVPIFGGYDKNISFVSMAESVAKSIEWAALIGATAPKIADALDKAGVRSTIYPTLEHAVKECAKRAGSSGVVLLTPGCASYDMFSDYEQRGDIFRSLAERRCEENG